MRSMIWFISAQFLGSGALTTPRLGILSRKHFDRDSKSLLRTTWLRESGRLVGLWFSRSRVAFEIGERLRNRFGSLKRSPAAESA